MCKIKSSRIELELTRRGGEDCRNKRIERMTDRRRRKTNEQESMEWRKSSIGAFISVSIFLDMWPTHPLSVLIGFLSI